MHAAAVAVASSDIDSAYCFVCDTVTVHVMQLRLY